MIDPRTVMYEEGRRQALALQERAPEMTGTEIIAAEGNIPAWAASKDYTGWKAGYPVTDEGQVWLLQIPHRASDYSGRPSSLRAIWALAHTADPSKAKPWSAPYGSSGLYVIGECCTYPVADGSIHAFRNLYDKNEFPPMTLNVESRWEDLGEIGTI